MQGLMHAMCADGGPVKLFPKERERMELDGDNSFANVEWFSGSFHLLINSLRNLNGKHSKDMFSFFWSQWRKTSPRLDWALGCSDPRDVLNELFQHKVANTRNIVDHLVGMNQIERNEHIVERAEKYPIVHSILTHLKFTNAILMLRNACRSGDHGDVESSV